MQGYIGTPLRRVAQRLEIQQSQSAPGCSDHLVPARPGPGLVLGARVLAEFGDDPYRYGRRVTSATVITSSICGKSARRWVMRSSGRDG